VPVDVFEIGLADKALSHAQFLAQSSPGRFIYSRHSRHFLRH
jgi:hypothetical protein